MIVVVDVLKAVEEAAVAVPKVDAINKAAAAESPAAKAALARAAGAINKADAVATNARKSAPLPASRQKFSPPSQASELLPR